MYRNKNCGELNIKKCRRKCSNSWMGSKNKKFRLNEIYRLKRSIWHNSNNCK